MSILAWHWSDGMRTRYDSRPIVVGETLRVDPPIELCKRGLHASAQILDALKYAPGTTISRVRLSGEIVRGQDKLVATERTVLWSFDARYVLVAWAADCAERALRRELDAGREPDSRSWAAIGAARNFASNPGADADYAAADAAADAHAAAARAAHAAHDAVARAAYDAAHAAACAAYAAAYAACAADAHAAAYAACAADAHAAAYAAHAAHDAVARAAYAAYAAAHAAHAAYDAAYDAAYAAYDAAHERAWQSRRLRALVGRARRDNGCES